MYIKKHLIGILRTLNMQRKSMRFLFYIPILFNWIIIPMLVSFIYGRWGDTEMSYVESLKYIQYFTPFLSVWWILFAFAEYVEGKGNELYYVQGRMRYKNILAWLIIYLIVMAVPFFAYGTFITGFQVEIFRLAIESILFIGITYMLLFLLGSVPMTMVALLIYAIVSAFSDLSNQHMLLYYDIRVWTSNLFIEKYFPILMVGIVMFSVGVFANRKFNKYQLKLVI